MLVSDVAGTTRDSVDTNFRWHQRQFHIVDTAGIRKPGRVARAGRGRIGQRAVWRGARLPTPTSSCW